MSANATRLDRANKSTLQEVTSNPGSATRGNIAIHHTTGNIWTRATGSGERGEAGWKEFTTAPDPTTLQEAYDQSVLDADDPAITLTSMSLVIATNESSEFRIDLSNSYEAKGFKVHEPAISSDYFAILKLPVDMGPASLEMDVDLTQISLKSKRDIVIFAEGDHLSEKGIRMYTWRAGGTDKGGILIQTGCTSAPGRITDGNIEIAASNEFYLMDKYLVAAIPLSQMDNTELSTWFGSGASIIGALNELASERKATVIQGYGHPGGGGPGTPGDIGTIYIDLYTGLCYMKHGSGDSDWVQISNDAV